MNATILVFLLGCSALRADVLGITFEQSTVSGSPGGIAQFFGVLDNTTGSDLYLNADNFNLAVFPPGSVDDSPFFANTPSGLLGPDASSGNIGLFNIAIPNSFSLGDYDGTFQILGGGTPADQTIVGTANFTVLVSTPEPASALLAITAFVLAMKASAAKLRPRQ